jgi:hypothetical protein
MSSAMLKLKPLMKKWALMPRQVITHCYVWLTLILLLSWGTLLAMPRSEVVPGGVLVMPLAVSATELQPAPVVLFNNHRVLVTQQLDAQHGLQWVAMVGIPLTAMPGQAYLKVFDLTHQTTTFEKFIVKNKYYPQQSIQINNSKKVKPPAYLAKRLHQEARQLNMAFSKWQVHPSILMQDFILPVNGPISSPFGAQRLFNGEIKTQHRGIDFAAPIDAPVFNAAKGNVSLVGDFYFTGKTVVVDHGQGLQTIYCHLNQVLVKPQQSLEQGSKLGTVGQTGRATGPHLHFGVNLNNTRVDPNLFLLTAAPHQS